MDLQYKNYASLKATAEKQFSFALSLNRRPMSSRQNIGSVVNTEAGRLTNALQSTSLFIDTNIPFFL